MTKKLLIITIFLLPSSALADTGHFRFIYNSSGAGYLGCGSSAPDNAACRAWFGTTANRKIGNTITVTGTNHNNKTFTITSLLSPSGTTNCPTSSSECSVRVNPIPTAPLEGGGSGLLSFWDVEPPYVPPAFYQSSYVPGVFTSSFTQLGSAISTTVINITLSLVALLCLGMGLRYLYRWIFNWPGTSHYNPRFGSGSSRWQKGRRNSQGGINLLADEFGSHGEEETMSI